MKPDVLIIGGGLIGLTIARELRTRGIERITIIERGEIGAEASWAAAGMLAPNIEAGASDVFHRFCIESLELYPALAKGLFADTGVDIHLDRSGTIGVAFDPGTLASMGEHVALGAQALTCDEVRALEPQVSHKVIGGVFFPNDWQVDNRALIAALRTWAEANHIELVEHTEVTELNVVNGRVTGAVTSNGDVGAGTTVLATGAWTSLIKAGGSSMPFRVKPIRGQMAAFDTRERKIGRVVYSPRGYLVPRSDGRVLVGATVEDAGFEKITTAGAIESLREAAVEIFPFLADFPIAERWSGLRPYVADGLPVIGEVPSLDGVLVATAHYRNGILLAPRTAQLIAEKIVADVDSEFFVPFGAGRFLSPATNVATPI